MTTIRTTHKTNKTNKTNNKTRKAPAAATATQPYVLIRSTNAGVFVGNLVSRSDQEVVLTNARRLWYWSGASSLSELAMKGVSRPAQCKFPCEVPEITILGTIEIIPVTEAAKASIAAVPVWTQH